MLADYQAEAKLPLIIATDEEGGGVVRASAYKQYREQPFASPQRVYAEGGFAAIAADAAEKAQLLLGLGTVGATVGFYFILRALGTANLLVSTASVATSFLAAMLAACRNPYYALVYALIVSAEDNEPFTFCKSFCIVLSEGLASW